MASFTLAEIPDQVTQLLPEHARLEIPPQGMTSDVAFAIGSSHSVVVKRCSHAVYVDWLRRETLVLRALADTGLPIPVVAGYAEAERTAGPEGWLVMTRLPGRSLWGVVLESRERAPLLRSLGVLLRRLHSTPIPSALRNSTDWVSRMLTQAQRNLSWCDGTRQLLTTLELTRPAPVAETLVHGDLALDNVLIDDSSNLSFVDWPSGDSGDPRYDLALALRTQPEADLSAEEVRAFYEGYGGAPLDAYTRRWFEQLYEFF